MGFIKGPVPPLYTQLADIQRMALERCYRCCRPGDTVGDLGPRVCRSSRRDTPFTCRILMHGKGLGDDAPIAIYGTRDSRMSDWPIETVCSPKRAFGCQLAHDG